MINPSELNVKDQVFKQNKRLLVKELLDFDAEEALKLPEKEEGK